MASLERRGKRWSVRVRGPDGRQVRRTFRTHAQAREFMSTSEADKSRGGWVDPAKAKITFTDYAEKCMAESSHLREGTRAKVRGHLDNHVLPAFGKLAMGSIQPSMVRAWISEMTSKGRAPATVASVYRTFSSILRTAEIDRVIVRTPCLGIKLPKDDHREEMRFLDADEVRRLAEAIDPRYRALVYVAAYSGARWGELAALRVDRVNILKGTLDIREGVTEVHGRLYSQGTKTSQNRTVTLPRPVAEILGNHIGLFPGQDGLVFSGPDGGPLRRGNFYGRSFKPAVAAAGLDPGLRFHDLRHTHVALLIANGAHAKEIADRLGHSSPLLTMKTYAHVLPQLEEKLRDGLEETFQAARDTSSSISVSFDQGLT